MRDDQVINSAAKKTFWDKVIIQKLSAPAIIVFLVCASLAVSYVIVKEGYVAGLIILCIIVAMPVAYATVAYPKFGIMALITISFFINYASRLVPEPTPIGLVMDAMTYLLILGFFVKNKSDKHWDYFKNPITYLHTLGLSANETCSPVSINPASPSILEWVFTVRTVGFIMLMYFVFLYHIRTKEFIKLLIKLWLALELIAAFAGFQQEHIGLFGFENEWLHRFPERYKLLFIGGHLRKWGIFSDPVVYAYNMVAAALVCIALMFGPLERKKKIILGFMAAFFFAVMLYSGTRASYLIIPAGLSMLFILNFNKKVLIFAVVCALMLGVLIRVPTSNPTLARFQSAFRPSKDASFEERLRNP